MEDSKRHEDAAQLLEARGRQVGPVRVGAGRSGVAVAFPRDPMLHISWAALATISALIATIKIRRAST